MLCDYGCGQEAVYQFKNGKWCCSKTVYKCLIFKKKLTSLTKRLWENREFREKMIVSHSGQVPWNKGKEGVYSNQVIEQIRNFNKGKVRSEEHRRKISESNKNKHHCSDKTREKMSKKWNEERREKHKIRMKNGQASYMNSFIKNPSKGELKLREVVLELYPESIPQCKILNYSVDIALLKYKIAIEYDGYYHFNCLESTDYHNKRQEEIENQGWRFIRYNIFREFPSKEQVEGDIQKLVK